MGVLLEMLKIDLGIMSSVYDSRLTRYLESAVANIIREGASIDITKADDAQLAVMYAAWMWRRRDSGEGMPRMLRWALNNRIFSEKMGGLNG